MADREGAFLKPTVGGERVDLNKVDRMSLQLLRKGPSHRIEQVALRRL